MQEFYRLDRGLPRMSGESLIFFLPGTTYDVSDTAPR